MNRDDVSATRDSITIATDLPAGTPIDISFDGARVWSAKVPGRRQHGRVTLPWPRALKTHLDGYTTLSVRRSDDQSPVAEAEVRFGQGDDRVSLLDRHGRWLVVNKWNLLAPAVEGSDPGLTERLIERTAEIVDLLQANDYAVYITGGSLLGAMRGGRILPHDDDTDLGVYFEADHPADLSLASYEMQRLLEAAGFTVVRHSTAHLQVTFFHESGDLDHYVDIFTAFHKDGVFNQPIAVRGEFAVESLFPLTEIELEGRSFPSVADPEGWLTICYGPGWRTPDPSFRFKTPVATRRRFESWFGVYNLHRVYWEGYYSQFDDASEVPFESEELLPLLERLPSASEVLELGSGAGATARALAAAGHRVRSVDYAYQPLRLATHASTDGIDFQRKNLNDRREIMELAADYVGSGIRPHVVMTHTLETINDRARAIVFLMLRQLLDASSFAFITIDTSPSKHFEHTWPDTWHLPVDWLEREIRPFELEAEVLATGHRSTHRGERRSTATVILRKKRK